MEEEIEKQSEGYADEHKHILYNDCIVIDNDYARQKQAFQDGAKWGIEHAIEWHDLRKNPDDLPKEKELVLLLICASVRVIGWYDNNRFIMDVNGRMFDKEDVIKWCELPTYKE